MFGGLGWLCYHHWLGIVIVGAFAIPFRRIYERYGLQRQRSRAYEELRDMLYILASAFAVGRGLKEAMRECCDMLRSSYGGSSLLAADADYICRAMEQGNGAEGQLLQEFARRSGLAELKQAATIYELCRKTGGDLPGAMIETSNTMLRRLQLWEEIRSQTAQRRLEFTVMLCVIPLLLWTVNATSDYMAPLYETAAGRVWMTVALGALFGAAAWSASIVEEGR